MGFLSVYMDFSPSAQVSSNRLISDCKIPAALNVS